MQIAQQDHDRNSQVICNTLSIPAPQSKGKKQSSSIKSSNLNSYHLNHTSAVLKSNHNPKQKSTTKHAPTPFKNPWIFAIVYAPMPIT
jgi:hypothetical protein